MKDPRIAEIARVVVEHSVALQTGERVLIEAIDVPIELTICLIRAATQMGAIPHVVLKDDQIIREIASVYSADDVKLMADAELHLLRQMDAFIGVRGGHNTQEYADVPPAQMHRLLQHYIQPVHHDFKNNNLKWVAMRWPTPAMAQRASMSTEGFEDYFFDVCCVDYASLDAAMVPLCELMARTNVVRIVGPYDTDLSFSIEGMNTLRSAGHHNIPDGELLTAPLRGSVEGRIRYNTPSVYYGTLFTDVCLDFRRGRAVCATANDSRRLNELLDIDEGARYVGEFAFGVHPKITTPIQDILFDEKMTGSVHLAQGNAYRACDNGNRSAIHWDLILLQSAAAGGGEVQFDGATVSRDGRFVLPELAPLNPDNEP